MGREIKFRAWDKELKRMWWNVQTAYDGHDGHGTPEPRDTALPDPPDEYFSPDSFGSVLGDENLVVEQFTGLHDKNGREIYEGDIVKTTIYEKERIHEIKFGKLSSATNGGEYSNSVFVGFGVEDAEVNEYLLSEETIIEVIGNRWENPELLEGK